MELLLSQSQEIINKALADYKPYAVVLMLSGGHDSLLAYHVAKALDVPMTHIMHGITGTGIKETTDFARKVGEESGLSWLEANAGDSYERYVLRKGFYGIGHTAHTMAYHTLKSEHFKKALSRHIRQGQKGRNILLINGARRQESQNRKLSMIQPIKVDKGNIWVNIVNDWSALDRNTFLSEYERNPVYDILHRSAECLCGTMQNQETRKEVSYWFPKWGGWLVDLEREACNRGFCWKWGEDLPKAIKDQKRIEKEVKNGQQWLPMCQSCQFLKITT
jgi:3'-phosphoadenosine 5'-phosphosulfate sulfotransferase (PAPS reductase)/FAD synthetase